MKRLVARVLALAVLALGSSTLLVAHDGHEHRVMGRSPQPITSDLKDNDGKDVVVVPSKG